MKKKHNNYVVSLKSDSVDESDYSNDEYVTDKLRDYIYTFGHVTENQIDEILSKRISLDDFYLIVDVEDLDINDISDLYIDINKPIIHSYIYWDFYPDKHDLDNYIFEYKFEKLDVEIVFNKIVKNRNFINEINNNILKHTFTSYRDFINNHTQDILNLSNFKMDTYLDSNDHGKFVKIIEYRNVIREFEIVDIDTERMVNFDYLKDLIQSSSKPLKSTTNSGVFVKIKKNKIILYALCGASVYFDIQKFCDFVLKTIDDKKESSKIVFGYGNFLAFQLITKIDYIIEGEWNENCVGNYNPNKTRQKIYSIRSSDYKSDYGNKDRLTIEYDLISETVNQIKKTRNGLLSNDDVDTEMFEFLIMFLVEYLEFSLERILGISDLLDISPKQIRFVYESLYRDE